MPTPDDGPALGDFLRAARRRLRPQDVGLPPGGVRRVEGLRREEVSALAGLSVDYYVRLEQGRERHPSAQVVNSLARLFRFDRDERMHLARLAGLMPSIELRGTQEAADPQLAALLEAWPHTPAVVFNLAYDPLAQNRLGAALFEPFGTANLSLSVFLDPAAQDFYSDWPATARNTAGALRHSTGRAPDDARLAVVIATLLENSAEFRRLWADPFVSGKTITAKNLRHPLVGALDLVMQTFEVRDAPGQELVVYSAAPGSLSDEALRILGSMSAAES